VELEQQLGSKAGPVSNPFPPEFSHVTLDTLLILAFFSAFSSIRAGLI
jgi:hypothetical protein